MMGVSSDMWPTCTEPECVIIHSLYQYWSNLRIKTSDFRITQFPNSTHKNCQVVKRQSHWKLLMSLCLIAWFKLLVNCINVSVWSSVADWLLRGNPPGGTTGVLLFGVEYSSTMPSWPRLPEPSSLRLMPPDGAAGVSGLARLGSEVFLAVFIHTDV